MKPTKRNAYARMRDTLRRVYLVPVLLYRRFVSPYKGVPSCRFTPTCSKYAVDAVTEWGIVIGTVMTAWRVVRCNPFSAGGYDPVPTKKEVADKLRLRKK